MLQEDRGKGSKFRNDILDLTTQVIGQRYRTTTLIEWQYCATAGSDPEISSFFWGDKSLIDLASEYGNRSELFLEEQKILECGRLIPNRLGLFDLVGNVREYCTGDVSVNEESIYNIALGGDCGSSLSEFSASSQRTFRVDVRYQYLGCRLVYTGN